MKYEFINEMFTYMDKVDIMSSHCFIFDLIKQKLCNSAMSLDPEQIKSIFDNFLEYHSKKIDDNYEQSIIIILNSMLQNHIDLFKKHKNFSNEFLFKFFTFFSIDILTDDDVSKALKFLNTIMYHIGEYIP